MGLIKYLYLPNCVFFQKYEMDKWSDPKESSMEKMLLCYLVTDYIGCGLASPEFHTVFHKNLFTEASKIKLLNDLVKFWDSLFKNYKISSMFFNQHFILIMYCK